MRVFFSIRLKLFLWITALVLGFVLFLLMLTNFFIKPFYINSQKKNYIEVSTLLNELYLDDLESFYTEVLRVERLEGYILSLRSLGNEMIYSTFQNNDSHPPMSAPPRNRPPNEIIDQKGIEDLSIGQTKYIFQEQFDPILNTTIFNMMTMISDDIILILSRPLASIDQSIHIASRFISIAGIISLIAGSIVALILSSLFTQPIQELTDIAVSMSRLDFSKKYKVTTNDEIGSLGSSINSLSDQLNRSISDLQKMNEGLLVENEEKQKIDDMRKDFIFSISHELRTPLSLIKGYAEGLLENIASDEESRNYYCEVIVDETSKMEKHVQNLLELSYLESANYILELSDFNIMQLIDSILMKYKRVFQEKNVSCTFDMKGNIPVRADRVRIIQVLENYITNALNHIDGTRQISLSVDKTIYNKVRVNVSNTGSLIPEDSIDKIWHSYYKVDKARSRQYGGYGLGLSIVKAIQDQHDNDYGVQNAEDKVIFWFELTPAINSCT
jgi:signal transduction histidine kinase